MSPRVDVAIKNVEFRDDGYKGIDPYEWYREGINLRNRINEYKLWEQVIDYDSYKLLLDKIPPINLGMDRGFVSSVSCTASQFLSICDKLVWHESMTDECLGCKDCDTEWYYAEFPTKCMNKVARPCPLTAHPVREIEIVNAGVHSRNDLELLDRWIRELAPKYGIEFTINDE